jgi:hypothetical protein
MDDDEIRRLAERIRQSTPTARDPEAADDAIPMLTEVVAGGAPDHGDEGEWPADDEFGSDRGRSATVEPASREPAGLFDDALQVALEVRIADQVLGRLLQEQELPGASVDEAVRSAVSRMAGALAVELQAALARSLREQLEPAVREAVRDAVSEAIEEFRREGGPL